MSSAETAHPGAGSVVIYRSVNRDGETYALEPRSLKRVRERFGAAAHVHPRIFIAHETRTNHDYVRAAIAPQVVLLLTGLSEEQLAPLGGVTFRDPVTDQDLERTVA